MEPRITLARTGWPRGASPTPGSGAGEGCAATVDGGHPSFAARGALAEPDLMAWALVVALASSVLPYSLELEALRRLPEAVFGVLMSLDPAVTALAGFL